MLSFSFGLFVVFAYIGVKRSVCESDFLFSSAAVSLGSPVLYVRCYSTDWVSSVFLSPHAAGTVARGFLRCAFFSILLIYN